MQEEVDDDEDEERFQDVVSQFPLLNGYSHILLGFQINADTPRDSVVAALRAALGTITDQISWLGGQMLHVSGKAGSSGVWKPAPWPAGVPPNDMMRVKDCDEVLPPMAQILRAGAPISMLKGDILTPWPSLPVPHGLKAPFPIVAVQANFVRGGLLLVATLHHVASDAVGLVQLLRLLATALSGREIAQTELEQANRDRRRVVPLIPRGEPVKDYSHLRRPAGWTPNPPSSPPRWCYFKIPVAALPALRKEAASSSATSEGGPPQLVSDNDILCAFCWQRISVVRLARGFSPDTPIKFTRAIDGRSAVGVPCSYMGHMAHHSIAQMPLGRVVSAPLSTITHTLRRSLIAANTTWAIRSYATFLAREPDKTALVYGGLRDVNIDLGATSLVASAGDEKDTNSALPESFGPLLGRTCFIRRPYVSPLTSTITIQPAEGGALPVCLCLPEDDMEALKKDAGWRRYTRYIG